MHLATIHRGWCRAISMSCVRLPKCQGRGHRCNLLRSNLYFINLRGLRSCLRDHLGSNKRNPSLHACDYLPRRRMLRRCYAQLIGGEGLPLAMLGFHVLAALVAVVTGIIAMLSAKHPGPHPPVWDVLLLVPQFCLPHRNHPCSDEMARGCLPFFSGSWLFFGGNTGTHRKATTMADCPAGRIWAGWTRRTGPRIELPRASGSSERWTGSACFSHSARA